MKNIAFKRAKNCPAVKDSLHPDFITEYADTTLFPEGFHKPEDGYEILGEDLFQEELLKNDDLHQQFLKEKEAKVELERKIFDQAELTKLREKLKKQQEFEEFLAWKANRGN